MQALSQLSYGPMLVCGRSARSQGPKDIPNRQPFKVRGLGPTASVRQSSIHAGLARLRLRQRLIVTMSGEASRVSSGQRLTNAGLGIGFDDSKDSLREALSS